MAGLRFPLDAEKGGRCSTWHLREQLVNVGPVENLSRVAVTVSIGQHQPRPFPDTLSRILGVLKLSQLRRRREILSMNVGDPGVGQSPLQPLRIRPRILAAAHSAPLPNINHKSAAHTFQSRKKL